MDTYCHLAILQAIPCVSDDANTRENRAERLQSILTKITSHITHKGLRDCVSSQLKVLLDGTKIANKWLSYSSEGLRDHLIIIDYMNEEILDYERRLAEFCEIFGIPVHSSGWEEFRFILSILQLSDDIISQFKYAINVAWCEVYDLTPPDVFPGALGTELFPRELRMRLKQCKKYRDRRRNWVFNYSMFQGLKKGLMPCHPEVVEKNLNKHAKAIGAIRGLPDSLYERCQQLTEEISKDFGDLQQFTWNHPISRKATYDYGFGEGGNVGFLRDRYFRINDRDSAYRKLFHALRIEQFVGYVECGSEVFEVKSSSLTRYELSCECLSLKEITFVASPACILEPMKVRIITKPYQCTHMGLTQIQKFLWQKVCHHRSGFFSLIGSPLARENLAPILADWAPGKKFCSGDYSAATDNLCIELSTILYKGLLGSTAISNPRLFQKGLSSLTETTIDYDRAVLPNYPFEYKYILPEPTGQTNGQLMGNVISFPLLCLANYCLYHVSMERAFGRRFPLWKVPPVLINGDDILFCCSPKTYDIWSETVMQGGLVPSVGKNFFTDKFLQINSELWVPKTMENGLGEYKVVQCEKIPYVNFGLLTQRRKQDCSVDLSCISSCMLKNGVEHAVAGDGNPESWIVRLRNMVKIREYLMEDLPANLLDKVGKVFDSHVKPIFRACHLLTKKRQLYFGKVPDCYLDFFLRQLIPRKPNMALEHFPHLEEEKLRESDCSLEWKLVQDKAKLPYQNPTVTLSGWTNLGDKEVYQSEKRWRVPSLFSKVQDGDLGGYLA